MIAASGNWSGPPDNISFSDEENDTNDHENNQSLDMVELEKLSLETVEEVAKAIDLCKASVMDSDELSAERRSCVAHLIKLRQDIIFFSV